MRIVAGLCCARRSRHLLPKLRALLGASRLSMPDADEILQALDASVADISDPELVP